MYKKRFWSYYDIQSDMYQVIDRLTGDWISGLESQQAETLVKWLNEAAKENDMACGGKKKKPKKGK